MTIVRQIITFIGILFIMAVALAAIFFIIGAVTGIIGVLVGLIIGIIIGSRSPAPVAAPASAHDYSKITDVKTALGDYCDLMKLMPNCVEWTDAILSNHLENARQCLITVDWERNIEPFGKCLLHNNVPLYVTDAPSRAQLTATWIIATNDAVLKFVQATGTTSVEIVLTQTAQASK